MHTNKKSAKVGQAFSISPEIHRVINKLLKSDDDDATRDAQILCQLFSGKRSSYQFATDQVEEIPANVPFSIVGTTQVPYAVRLICQMDQGHGLLDRFLFLFPNCLGPNWLKSDDVLLKEITSIFLEMFDLHQEKSTYKFKHDALHLLKALSDDFI